MDTRQVIHHGFDGAKWEKYVNKDETNDKVKRSIVDDNVDRLKIINDDVQEKLMILLQMITVLG